MIPSSLSTEDLPRIAEALFTNAHATTGVAASKVVLIAEISSLDSEDPDKDGMWLMIRVTKDVAEWDLRGMCAQVLADLDEEE